MNVVSETIYLLGWLGNNSPGRWENYPAHWRRNQSLTSINSINLISVCDESQTHTLLLPITIFHHGSSSQNLQPFHFQSPHNPKNQNLHTHFPFTPLPLQPSSKTTQNLVNSHSFFSLTHSSKFESSQS